MIRAARLRQLCAIRQLKQDRAAIALARGNAKKTETADAAVVATIIHSQMQAEMPARLSEHLRAASVLRGATSRYTAYVLAANADHQALALQRDIAEIAQREADLAHRAAEAFWKLHAVALRRREALDELAQTLSNAETRLVLLREEDVQSDQRTVPVPAGGLPR
jgi:hypothetical protein